VIYRPDTERRRHHFHARLTDQFDAVLHIDETRAVEPLERTALWVERRAGGDVSDGPVIKSTRRIVWIGTGPAARRQLQWSHGDLES
jgi:hypothetical protein